MKDKIDKEIKKGIQQAKEGKTVSAKEYFKKMTNRKYPWYEKVWDFFIYRLWGILGDTRRGIKWFIQRGKNGYADCDTWNLCSYLPKVIYKSVEELLGYLHGYPTDMTYKQWKSILQKIINSFKIMEEIHNGEVLYLPTKKWTEKEYKKLKDLAKRMNKIPECNYKVMTKNQSIKYEKGLQLFIENLGGLWD